MKTLNVILILVMVVLVGTLGALIVLNKERFGHTPVTATPDPNTEVPTSEPGAPKVVRVVFQDLEVMPKVAIVSSLESVTFFNKRTTEMTVMSDTGAFPEKTLKVNEEYKVTLGKGEYPFSVKGQPGLSGKIIVEN